MDPVKRNASMLRATRMSMTDSLYSLLETPQLMVPKSVEQPKVRIDPNSSTERYSFRNAFSIAGSVIPAIIVPVALFSMWALFWAILALQYQFTAFLISNQLVIILNVSVSLLLVFKNNSSYDRFMESRRIWGTMVTCLRNLSRSCLVKVQPKNDRDRDERVGVLQLLIAYQVAMKHYLRNELGVGYADLYPLICHVPSLRKWHGGTSLPLQITWHIGSYISKGLREGTIKYEQHIMMVTALSTLVENLTSFERIQNTPIPWAYSVHLKQTVLLHLLALPFQLIGTTFYASVPIVAVSAFVLLGIEKIGAEIEFPFGFEASDLPLEQFCGELRAEIEYMIASYRARDYDPSLWHFNPARHAIQPPVPSNFVSMAQLPHHTSAVTMPTNVLLAAYDRPVLTASPGLGGMDAEGTRPSTPDVPEPHPPPQSQPHHHLKQHWESVEMDMVAAMPRELDHEADVESIIEDRRGDLMKPIIESARESEMDEFRPFQDVSVADKSDPARGVVFDEPERGNQ